MQKEVDRKREAQIVEDEEREGKGRKLRGSEMREKTALP
jgi:hypothetical protein